jgi:adenylyl-sulfate kinase
VLYFPPAVAETSTPQNAGSIHDPGLTIWLTGLPAAGKTTIGDALAAHVTASGRRAFRLDGDLLRRGLCADLGYSEEDRHENVRRAGHVAVILAESGAIVAVSLISPYADSRAQVRAMHEREGIEFLEVFVDTPLEECQRRDPRGLYAKAARAEIMHMTGLDDPYEPPTAPDVHVHPAVETIEQSTAMVLEVLAARLPTYSR